MWNVTRKGLLAHKLRLALTAMAIVLGVTFISGSFILTDTLENTFTTLVGNAYKHIDFEIRGDAVLNSGGGAIRNPISQSVLAKVSRVPGVAYADGSVTGDAQYVAAGNAISNGGATAGVSFDSNTRLSPFHLVAGTAPTTPSDVAMDVGTAHKYHFKLGDRVHILLPKGPQAFIITGFLKFGSTDNLAGTTISAFDLSTAQRLFGLVRKLDTINVLTAPTANKDAVQRAIARTLPSGVEVVTGQTVVSEETSVINQALSTFSTALLIFALIALFVGAFTILNTFSIIVGQRTRELALLRILGASRRQVFRSVLLEAAIVGLMASLIGLGLGVLAAKGLEAMLSGFGVSLPSGSLVFEARTVAVALGVGVGVTVVSAISPARRAVRIPPVEAISVQGREREASSRRRIAIGGACAVLSGVVLGAGLAASAILLVGVGAVGVFIGVGMLAPVVARPMSGLIGRPLARWFGIAGQLGRENSMCSPRRTAQTATALMVGIALVSAMSVYGASLSRSATASVDNALRADVVVTGPSVGFPNSVVAAVARVPGVTSSATIYRGEFDADGSLSSLVGVSTDRLADTVILRIQAGSAETALASGQLLVDTTTANNDHLLVGSVVGVKFARTGDSMLRIGGIFRSNALIGHYLVGRRFFLAHYTNALPIGVLLKTDGSSRVFDAINAATTPYPNVGVQTRAQFEKSQVAQVNQLLGLVYALLALAVLIALIGIVNTLLLSVFERTREIGLLRAVGMKRRQIRIMIRSEAVILSLFGAVTGVIVGTGLGTALVSSLRESQGITDIIIPFSRLALFLVIAALLGLGAASWPARRAAKLDVLTAISTN